VSCLVSRCGVIPGIHYSDVPRGEAKHMSCAARAVLKVVLDLRVGSPGFGKSEAVRLDDEDRRAALLAEGLGRDFMALSGQPAMLYLCLTPCAPGREHGVHHSTRRSASPGRWMAWPALQCCRAGTLRRSRSTTPRGAACCLPMRTAPHTPRDCPPRLSELT